MDSVVKNLMIGGVIKRKPEDFIVEEIIFGKVWRIKRGIDLILDFLPKERKQHLHFTLVKKNWNTYDAIKEIGKAIHASPSRFGFAGMKDRDAITAQRVSLFNGDVSEVRRVKIKDIILKEFEYSDRRIYLGDHWGNEFTIRIRNIIHKEEVPKLIEKFSKEGFRNYFGEQRFGIERTNHLVGKYIIMGNFEKAVRALLSFNDFAMKNFGEWKEIIHEIPQKKKWERRVVEHLINYPNDYAGALRKIPKRIRRIYVNAYQSYVFNEVLKRYENPPEKLPLPGTEVEFDEVTEKFLEEEGLSKEDFEVPRMPELRLEGMYRKTKIYPRIIKWKIKGNDLIIKFDLEKGAYATVFLDQFTHTNP